MTLDSPGVKVEYEIGHIHAFSGYVSAEATSFNFTGSSLFLEAVQLADNFDVYTKTNGCVHMSFCFWQTNKQPERKLINQPLG